MEAASWIALAAIVSGGLVTLSGTVERLPNGRSQRKHERRLAVEEREWSEFRAALRTVVAHCRRILDALVFVEAGEGGDENRYEVLERMSRARSSVR